MVLSLGPLYTCLGLPIGLFDSLISFHWAIQPGILPNANITVNISEGIPSAL